MVKPLTARRPSCLFLFTSRRQWTEIRRDFSACLIAVFPVRGVESADIGRIASKHVKVAVTQRSLQAPGRVKQTVTSQPNDTMNNVNMMNHVHDTDGVKSEAEAMDTDHDGVLLLLINVLLVVS